MAVALRILVADDSMTAQNMGKKILAEAGYDVVTVSNGAAALKKIAEMEPDLVVLDVYMPGYSGLEVCERMKNSVDTAKIPVLLTVGKMEPFRPEDGTKVKADGVIIKPFEATDLVAVIEKLAERVSPASHARTAPSEESATPVSQYPATSLSKSVSEGAASFVPAVPAAEEATLENFAEQAAITAAVGQVDEHPELQTFAPPAEKTPSAPDSRVEFTAASQIPESADEPLETLEPTIIAPPEITPSLESALMHDFGTPSENSGFSLLIDEVGQDAEEHPSPWKVEDAALKDNEVNLDLSAEMRAAGQAWGTQAHDGDGILENSASPRESTVSAVEPLLAPIGKTSFDEFDSVAEEAAARFDDPPSARVERNEEDVADGGGPAAESNSVTADAIESVAAEPGLMSEDYEHVVSEPAPPAMPSIDSLNGVFEMTSSPELTKHELDGADPQDSVHTVAVVSQAEREPQFDAMLVSELEMGRTSKPFANPDSTAFVEDAIGLIERSLPRFEEVDLPDYAPDDCSDVESDFASSSAQGLTPAAEPEVTDAPESLAAEPETNKSSVEQSSDVLEDMVGRVVERVMVRLKPVLSVIVEEVVREMKK